MTQDFRFGKYGSRIFFQPRPDLDLTLRTVCVVFTMQNSKLSVSSQLMISSLTEQQRIRHSEAIHAPFVSTTCQNSNIQTDDPEVSRLRNIEDE